MNPLLDFLRLAYDDYIAARSLLLNGLLRPAAVSASTALEKELKAVLLEKHIQMKGHLLKLLKPARNQQRSLYIKINEHHFMEFLAKAYVLRYRDDIKLPYSLVINQFRTLAKLDEVMHVIDSGFKLTQGNTRLTTPYQQAVANKDSQLYEDNYVLLKLPKQALFQRCNKVFEISIDRNGRELSASYETEAVNDHGSFIKEVDIGVGKTRMQLTLG